MELQNEVDIVMAKMKKRHEEYNKFLEEFKKEHPSYDKIQELQDNLRNLRNTLTDEYSALNNKIQKEIDNCDFMKFDVTSLKGKYVKINNDYNYDIYMHIEDMTRRYDGVSFSGPSYTIYNTEDNEKGSICVYTEFEITINYINMKKTMTEITKDEFINIVKNASERFYDLIS